MCQPFLADRVTPELAGRFGCRPASLKQDPAAAISRANGADPSEPKRVLGLPEPRVLAKLKEAWRADRKPANVLLVLDTSGSMVQEDRLTRAKQGLTAFLGQVASQDRVGLATFADEIRPPVPNRSMAPDGG